MCFINLEGADGSGKTTVLEIVKKNLESKVNIVTTKEPQGIFRDFVLDPTNKLGLTETARMFIYQADRAIHIENFVKPNLAKGNVVISDRGPMSTFVYQTVAAKLTFDELYNITKTANQSIWPDLFILFDLDYEVAKERMDGRELDYFDSKGKDFYDQLSQLYRLIAHQLIEDFGFDVRIINARNPLDYVVREVQSIIEQKLKI